MPSILTGLGRWLRGDSRPQAFDVIDESASAEPLSAPVPTGQDAPAGRPSPSRHDAERTPLIETLPRERRPAVASSAPLRNAPADANPLDAANARALQDVGFLARQLTAHLDEQARRADESAQSLASIAQVLETIPRLDADRQQLVTALTEHFADEAVRSGALRDILARLDQSASGQADALGSLFAQIEAAHRLNQETAVTLQAVRDSLSGIGQAHAQSAEVMRELAGTTLQQRDEFTYAIERHSRLLIIVVLTCGALSIGAIILALTTVMKLMAK